MIEHFFTCGGTCIAFFCNADRIASITITRTDHQTAIIRTPADDPAKLARWLKHPKATKDHFFKLYAAATALNAPGVQKYLEFLPLAE